MEPKSANPLREVFLAAADLDDPQARAAYLDKACAGDESLRRRVEALLSAEAQAGGPPPEVPPPAQTSSDPTLGNRVGHYKLLQQIGEGGCGVVFMAEQEEPVRRKVALKVIKLGMDTKQVVARFEAERQALAMMDHPNIAQVFDAGATDSGRPYFVMELVRGIKITDYCDEHRFSTRQRLDLFIQVCHAVQHAHQKGIIHRDLKPSNILVTELDGVPLPKIIDFGIAKAVEGRLTDQTVFTAFEQFIGTPAYMSPEQAALTATDIDTRSDIYSLGVLLYELLTGKTPFETKALLASGLEAMRKTIQEKEPLRPSTRLHTLSGEEQTTTARSRGTEVLRLVHLIRGDLDWIVMKCLEKERKRRYETANGLALDLHRHLDNEPVLARPPSRLYEFQKTVRRHKFGFGATAALLLLLTAGVLVSTWLYHREKTERKLAQDNLYFADIRVAYNEWQSGQIAKTLELLRRNIPQGAEPDRRGWEWYYLLSLCHRDERTLIGHTGEVYAVSCDPAGRRFASAGHDHIVRIWDAESGACLAELKGHNRTVFCVAWSPDGTRLASGGLDGKLILWNARTFQRLLVLDCDRAVEALAWRPDGKQIAAGGADYVRGYTNGLLTIWDANSGERLHYLKGNVGLIWSLAWHPAGKLLAAGENHDGRIEIWDADKGQLLRTFEAHWHAVVSLAWRPDGRQLASASGTDQRVRIWDAETWKPVTTIDPAHNGSANTIFWSEDGRRLVSGGADGLIKIWDPRTGQQLNALRGHQGPVTSVAWWPGHGRILSGSADGTVKIWNPESEQVARTVAGAGTCAWSPDGRQLAVGGPPGGTNVGVIQILDAATWRTLLTLSGITNERPRRLAWTPDGRRLAVAFVAQVQVWDLATRKEILFLPKAQAHTGKALNSVAWSPDGQLLATAGGDRAVRLWNVETKENVLTFLKHSNNVASAVWSPDGRWIASKDFFGGVLIWSTSTGQVRIRLRGAEGFDPGTQYDVTWSPRGDELAAGCANGTIRVWDATTGRVLQVLKGHTSEVRSVQWSPDGRRLVSGAEDRTIRVWDSQSGRELLVLPDPSNARPSVAWSPSGRMIGAEDDSALVYDATLGYELAPQLAQSSTNP